MVDNMYKKYHHSLSYMASNLLILCKIMIIYLSKTIWLNHLLVYKHKKIIWVYKNYHKILFSFD
jgi:hypothetical protein